MALSNLQNEPRRELIEQVTGLATVAAIIGGGYGLVRWLGAVHPIDVVFGTLFCSAGLVLAIGFLTYGVHAIGEGVCGFMRGAGFDPRPRDRTRR